MSFDLFVKEWTRHYKPMQHNEQKGNRRFFYTDGLRGLVDFATQATDALSPCVVMESNLAGIVEKNRVTYTHVLYFFVHARDMAKGHDAMLAKKEAVKHMLEFYAYLQSKREDGDQELRGIDTEHLMFSSEGPEQNGWYACQVQFDEVVMRNTCVIEANYV